MRLHCRQFLVLMLLMFLCMLTQARGQVASIPFAPPQYFDNSGKPLAGGRLFSFSAGTSTNLATYCDALGTVNHSLLTIAEARRRGLAVRGVILSRGATPGPDSASNAAAIARHGDVPMLGTLPFLPGASDAELAAAASYTLALDALFSE